MIANGSFDNTLLQGGKIWPDFSAKHWFFLDFNPLLILHESDLKFEFRDIDNPLWKTGMKWDFVELKQLNEKRKH